MEPPRRQHASPAHPRSAAGDELGAESTHVAGPGRERREHATSDDAHEPVSDVHPALAKSPPCVADRHWAVDRILFTVAAAMALGFVAWGFATPTGLGAASSSVLGWITGNLGWLFVLLSSAFVVDVI